MPPECSGISGVSGFLVRLGLGRSREGGMVLGPPPSAVGGGGYPDHYAPSSRLRAVWQLPHGEATMLSSLQPRGQGGPAFLSARYSVSQETAQDQAGGLALAKPQRLMQGASGLMCLICRESTGAAGTGRGWSGVGETSSLSSHGPETQGWPSRVGQGARLSTQFTAGIPSPPGREAHRPG